MTILGNDHGMLNQQLCWNLWAELGTLQKVQLEFQRRNITRANGDSFSRVGIARAAHCWVLEHPQECFPQFQKEFDMSWEDFEQWLVLKAAQIYYTESRFRKWLKMMGFYENQKYKDLYADRFPLIHPN